MLELRESPKEVGHALAQTDLADKENLKPVFGRFRDALEAIQSHAVGDLVELLRGTPISTNVRRENSDGTVMASACSYSSSSRAISWGSTRTGWNPQRLYSSVRMAPW